MTEKRSTKSEQPKKLFMMKTKPRHLTAKKIITAIIGIVIVFSAIFGLNRYNLEQDNADIRGLILTYYQALNNQEYSLLEDLYAPTYPESTQVYIDNIQLKMEAVNFDSIKAERIYPALVHNDFGIAGVISKTTNIVDGKEASFKEFNVILVRHVNGRWYIAKPEDAQELGQDKLKEFFSKYKDTVKYDAQIKEVMETQQKNFQNHRMNQSEN